jgi:hypothetical protein
MKKILIAFLVLVSFGATASHIVGGEFELLHLTGYDYKINFILYFDLNGHAEAKDAVVIARIYRKSDNQYMTDVTLNLISEEDVLYTQPECARGDLRTSKITYSGFVRLEPSIYNDEDGYYLVWQRCCRNYNTSVIPLVNIVSQDPAGGNGAFPAGQTFYLDFPPVIKNGVPFVNSSPQLFPPLSDYACMGRPYYKDFGGTDVDGDSLVYSMTEPFDTQSKEALPPGGPVPEPYPAVTWISPYSINNIIGGHPDLRISRDGLLTTTPGNVSGLFVFAIKCEEFRNGVKIGELRRDFQIYIVDCQLATPPVITGRKLGDADFTYANNINVSFTNTVNDDQRCVEVQVSDHDAIKDGSEKVRIRVKAINFKKDVSTILPVTRTKLLTPDDSTATFKICFPQCPFIENGPMKIAIIAGDDACSLPLLDTLFLSVNIQKPVNSPAHFITPGDVQSVPEGSTRTWQVSGRDDDLDSLVVNMIADDFDPGTAGFSLVPTRNIKGFYDATLTWNANCSVFDFTHKTDFDLKIIIDDLDLCGFDKPDTVNFKMHVVLPENHPPIIGSTLSVADINSGIQRKIYESLNFTVFATDADGDILKLTGIGDNFNLADYNVSFPGDQKPGFVTSPFTWLIDCNKVDLKTKNDFDFTFIAADVSNKCRFIYNDTMYVKVHVLPPDDKAPKLTITNLTPEIPLAGNDYQMLIGQKITLEVKSTDTDRNPADRVTIELFKASGTVEPSGFSFNVIEGDGEANGTFTWQPDCKAFKGTNYSSDFIFSFRSLDNRCFNGMGDTSIVNINVKDIDARHSEFLPPNIITPNNDGCNDFFAMEGFEGVTSTGPCAEIAPILPKLPLDNCAAKFSSIRIYNRWGKEVFQSHQRNFRWYAKGEADGIFFYVILYENPEHLTPDIVYKGTVTVRF